MFIELLRFLNSIVNDYTISYLVVFYAISSAREGDSIRAHKTLLTRDESLDNLNNREGRG